MSQTNPHGGQRRLGRRLLPSTLRPLALAAAGLFAQASGLAAGPAGLPSGLQVMQGQASVATRGNAMTVTNSANAVLNWQQFSVGAGQSLRFDQPNAASKVLNRVLGQDASRIFGSLSSNGTVWLLNPNGVLFGAGARVDVAGLMASTLRINDADWAAGRYRLTAAADGLLVNAGVVNQGELRTLAGGRVMLVGGATVRNEGLIEAPDGQVLLAAGRSVDLVDSALPNLAVRVSAPQGEVLNLGRVLAGSGRIDLSAAIVNQQGIVRADGLGAGPGGQVQLLGSQGVDLGAGSLTSASGASGGRVGVDAGSGSAMLAGRLVASGGGGAGGGIQMLGRQIGLLDGAAVDASGAAGGTVHIGGGLQGRDASLRNAEAVYMAPGASVTADALGKGGGGLIVLWSDQATRAYGSLSARGGAQGGDGGFIETSGGWLDARPASVRTGATAGRHGQWLLDPHDIVITSDAGDTLVSGGPDFRSTGNVAVLSTATLEAALNANNNVTVTTSQGQGGAGDIRMLNATLKPAPAGPVSLTLNAHRNITFDFSTIRSDGAALSLVLNAGLGSRVVGQNADSSDVGGAVAIRSSTLDLKGGRLDIGGAVFACGANRCSDGNVGAVASDGSVLRDGILVAASSINVGSGSIKMRGHSVAEQGDAAGIALTDGSTLTAASIDLRGTVDSDGPYTRTGVKLAGGVITAAQTLSVDGAAYSGVYRDSTLPTGVDVLGELRVGVADQPGEASMTITGLSLEHSRPAEQALPVLRRFGVGIRGATAKLVAVGGAGIYVNGVDESNNGDLGILAAGSASAYIDASAGSQIRLDAVGDLKLSGDVRLPVGGPVSLASTGTLAINSANLSGAASLVSLQGLVVDIGGQGESTQLVFGDSTPVTIRAGQFRMGVSDFGLPSQGDIPPPPDTEPTRLLPALPDRHALADAQPPAAALAALALLSTGGVVTVFADSVVIGTGAQLHSTATGEALVLRGGPESNGVLNFANFGAADVFNAPNGKWLLRADSPDNTEGRFFLPGALRPDFRAYGVAADNANLPQAGNALLFAAQAVLSLDGTLARVYDGSDGFVIDGEASGLFGLQGGDRINGTWHTADKRVGSQKPLTLRSEGTGVVDENGAPVHGYRLDSESMVARIDPRLLSVSSFSAQDKTYDGNVNATVGGVQLSGVLAGDVVSPNAGGQFDSKQAGLNKRVTLTSLTLSGNDAGNYQAQLPDSGTTANIRPKELTISNAADGPTGSKVYDGNTVAPAVDGQRLAIAGLVAGDEVNASATGGNFADKRVGNDKSVTLTGVVLSGNDAGNYEVGSATTRADITPRALTVTATTAADKVYDGGTTANAAVVALDGVLAGDVVVGRGNGQFDDRNVGQNKPLTISSFSLGGGDAANYSLQQPPPATLQANITPATLVYRADGVNATTGSPLPALTGRVTGLVGEDTLATATTGQLAFATLATLASEPGRYAINGSGLAASNYVFTQAPANATALTLQAPPVVLPPTQDVTSSQLQALATVLPAPVATSPASGRALDAVQVVLPGVGADKQAFANLDLANLSQETLAAVLAARDQYKKAIFQQALSRLEQNPGLADAPGCATAQQAAAGQCLMISPAAQGLAISNARVVEQAALAVPQAPAAPAVAAPQAAPAAPAAPAQSMPTPAPGPLATAVAAAPPVAAYRLPVRRPVKAATLPQIQRKIAILIGIDQYSDARIPRLGNAVKDAKAVADSLETHLGYETVVLENPDRATIFKVLNQLAVEVGPADSVVLYYAGHGELVEKTGQGYWQASDADATRPETWIANADIDRLLKQLPASQSAMISDSCFSGGLVSGERIRGTSATQDPGALLSRRAAVVMTSGGNEPVFDSGKNGHSPFAYSLMQSLAQVNNWRPGSTLFEQVRFAVARQLPQRPQYGASRTAGHEAGADYLFEQRQLEGGRK